MVVVVDEYYFIEKEIVVGWIEISVWILFEKEWVNEIVCMFVGSEIMKLIIEYV